MSICRANIQWNWFDPQLGMLCTGQEDKLALIGTLSTIGRLVGMPVAGVISDR